MPKTFDKKVRRRIRVGICAPVTVEAVVKRSADGESWEIDHILRADAATVTPRSFNECADDETFREIDRQADEGEDL